MNGHKECFIVGGGPSLKDFDWSDLDGKFVIAINRSYEKLPNAQIVYFTDNDWWDQHKDALLQHKGKKIKGSLPNSKINHPDVEEYTITGARGLEKKAGHVRHGHNSTYAAINLAYHLGFKKVYLLGIDMKWGEPGKRETAYWHDGHRRITPEHGFRTMIEHFNTLAVPLKEAGMEVYNVTTDSRLPTFPKLHFWNVFGDKYSKPEQLTAKVQTIADTNQQYMGDHLEKVFEKVGIKAAAKVYERITKKPCGCEKRKQLINNMHRRIIQAGQPVRIEPLPKKK